MAFKMKYSPNKKTGAGFPFKRTDDLPTQNMLVSELEDAHSRGASEHELNQIVKAKSDGTTTYVIGSDGKVNTTARKGYKDPKTGENTTMSAVYNLEKNEEGKSIPSPEREFFNPVEAEGGKGGKMKDVTVFPEEDQKGYYDYEGEFTRTEETHAPGGDDMTSVDVETGVGSHEHGSPHEVKSLGGKLLNLEMKQDQKK